MGGEDGCEVGQCFAEAEELVFVERLCGEGREVAWGRSGRTAGLGQGVGGGERAGTGRRRYDAVDDVGGAFGEVGEGVVGGKRWDGNAGYRS